MKLSQLMNAWEELHVKDTGELGFCDLDKALTNAGVEIENDMPNALSQKGRRKEVRIMELKDQVKERVEEFWPKDAPNIMMVLFPIINAIEEKRGE